MNTDILRRVEYGEGSPASPDHRLTAADLARALEAERLRISRDLHDQTSQQVAILKFSLEDLKSQIPEPAAIEKLTQVICYVEQLATDLHTAVHGLRLSAVERFGLVPALDAMIADWEERFGIATDFCAEDMEDLLDPAIENALFCVAQESLTNVAKHALTAKAVSVILQRTKSEIVLTITDDGSGLIQTDGSKKNTAASAQTFGLLGLRERLELIGGELSVSSGQSGTLVTARVLSRNL